jgi:hypothetical protein
MGPAESEEESEIGGREILAEYLGGATAVGLAFPVGLEGYLERTSSRTRDEGAFAPAALARLGTVRFGPEGAGLRSVAREAESPPILAEYVRVVVVSV